jgi:hypothetical protein
MDIFSCSLAVASQRFPDGYLLQFTLPCGNGKHIETIDMVSPSNPRFPATINFPENVSKNEVFYRTEKSNHLGYFLQNVFAVPKGRTKLRKYVGRML